MDLYRYSILLFKSCQQSAQQNVQYTLMDYLKGSSFRGPAVHYTGEKGSSWRLRCHELLVSNKHSCLCRHFFAAPVVYPEAAVLDGAVHGELPCALLNPPLHYFTIASEVSHLEGNIFTIIDKLVRDILQTCQIQSTQQNTACCAMQVSAMLCQGGRLYKAQ